eukprot:127447-Ditylum_brightwellii.AAC.1
MERDELGTSIYIKPQPRQSTVTPETCVTAHGLDLCVAKSVRSLMMCPLAPPSAKYISTVDMFKIFSPNACKSDLKDVKLFHRVDDWE